MTILVCLPAYNEEEALGSLIPRLLATLTAAGLPHRVVVVDDGSRDGTARVVERHVSDTVILERHPVNQGLGRAIRTGLGLCARIAGPDDVVVTLDADGSHPVELIPALVEQIQGGADVVIASRFVSGARVVGVPWNRRVLSHVASILYRLRAPARHLRDYTCGFRAYRVSVLRKAFEIHGDDLITEPGFACMLEIVLKLRRMKVVFAEVPLVLRYDLKPGPSKMNVLSTIWQSFTLAWRSSRPKA